MAKVGEHEQYIFRINKGVLDESDDASVNEFVPETKRPIPFERMIYIADGFTDVPCMKLVKTYGGKSIAVYNQSDAVANQLIKDGRANFVAKADYREESDLEKLVCMIIDHMKADELLREREERTHG